MGLEIKAALVDVDGGAAEVEQPKDQANILAVAVVAEDLGELGVADVVDEVIGAVADAQRGALVLPQNYSCNQLLSSFHPESSDGMRT